MLAQGVTKMQISGTSPESLQCYRRWWLNKYLEDGRRIIRVKRSRLWFGENFPIGRLKTDNAGKEGGKYADKQRNFTR